MRLRWAKNHPLRDSGNSGGPDVAAVAADCNNSSCRRGHTFDRIMWPSSWHLLHFDCAFGLAIASAASKELGSLFVLDIG